MKFLTEAPRITGRDCHGTGNPGPAPVGSAGREERRTAAGAAVGAVAGIRGVGSGRPPGVVALVELRRNQAGPGVCARGGWAGCGSGG